MIKGKFTVKKSEQGDRELEALVRLLSPMLEPPGGRIKIKEDDAKLYTHVYMDLYPPDQAAGKYL